MEGAEGAAAPLMPFARQSRMVRRSLPEAAAPDADYSKREFWDWLSRQPSSPWKEEYRQAPSLLTSGRAAQRPGGDQAEAGPLPWQETPALQKLPSPKELFWKKKKGPKRKRFENARALSVFCHLEELKRRQSSIEELKAATWGVCVPRALCEGEEAPDPFPKAVPHGSPPRAFGMPAATRLYGEPASGDGYRHAQLLHPEWNPSAREQLEVSQERPIASYTVATHQRGPWAAVAGAAAAGRPEQEEEQEQEEEEEEEEEEEGGFWGFRLQSEE